MIKIKTKFLPKGVIGMAIFPFLLYHPKVSGAALKILFNHENIHFKQQLEMLVIFFYLWYGIEYLINLIKYKDSDKAYREISLEKEAYIHENDENYLKNRKLFAWFKLV